MQNELVIEEEIGRFVAAMRGGFEAWVEAGRVLKGMVDRWGQDHTFMRVRREVLVPENALRGFLRLGRNEIIPEILASREPWARAAARLPYVVQREVVDRRTVDVARKCGGAFENERIRLEDLSEKQCRQVFAENGVLLTFAQQLEVLKGKEKKKASNPCSFLSPRFRPSPVVAKAEVPEEEDQVTELLRRAQEALLKVRELNGIDHVTDQWVAAGLTAIGKIRNGMKFV